MAFKIITTHPIGMRTFTERADAERLAIGFRIADPENVNRVIVQTGSVLVTQRSN